jgi:RNA polymerase sigma-70 factor (ECF subfamily)
LFLAHIAGDKDAFRQLFSRYAVRIFAMLSREGMSRADAHDLVQQTFLLLHQARHDYEPELRVRPWLWTIAFNLLRSQRRGRARAEARLERLVRDRANAPWVSPHEAGYGLRVAISQLSVTQREIVMLHWYAGLSFHEIAAVVQASESAVKVRAHRAYRRLRELLDEAPRRTEE